MGEINNANNNTADDGSGLDGVFEASRVSFADEPDARFDAAVEDQVLERVREVSAAARAEPARRRRHALLAWGGMGLAACMVLVGALAWTAGNPGATTVHQQQAADASFEADTMLLTLTMFSSDDVTDAELMLSEAELDELETTSLGSSWMSGDGSSLLSTDIEDAL